MSTKKPPRVIESDDMPEIARAVREHDLKPTEELGEWTGIIDGQPVILRLIHPRNVTVDRIKHMISNALEHMKGTPTRAGQPASFADTIKRLHATAKTSRWF